MEIFFYAALGLTSIVGLTFIVERGLALRWPKVVPAPVIAAVENYRSPADLPVLRDVCLQNNSPLSRLVLAIAEHQQVPRAETIDILETRARHEVAQLERGLVVLEIVTGIAPLLGLVGTVFGLITLFGDISRTGLGNYNQLARGIGVAMYATLMGLLIAIPSLIAWSYYSKKVETFAIELETLCAEFLRRNYRRRERP